MMCKCVKLRLEKYSYQVSTRVNNNNNRVRSDRCKFVETKYNEYKIAFNKEQYNFKRCCSILIQFIR